MTDIRGLKIRFLVQLSSRLPYFSEILHARGSSFFLQNFSNGTDTGVP